MFSLCSGHGEALRIDDIAITHAQDAAIQTESPDPTPDDVVEQFREEVRNVVQCCIDDLSCRLDDWMKRQERSIDRIAALHGMQSQPQVPYHSSFDHLADKLEIVPAERALGASSRGRGKGTGSKPRSNGSSLQRFPSVGSVTSSYSWPRISQQRVSQPRASQGSIMRSTTATSVSRLPSVSEFAEPGAADPFSWLPTLGSSTSRCDLGEVATYPSGNLVDIDEGDAYEVVESPRILGSARSLQSRSRDDLATMAGPEEGDARLQQQTSLAQTPRTFRSRLVTFPNSGNSEELSQFPVESQDNPASDDTHYVRYSQTENSRMAKAITLSRNMRMSSQLSNINKIDASLRARVANILSSTLFGVGIGILVTISGIFMGIRIDFETEDNFSFFVAVELLFITLFTIEIMMRILVEGLLGFVIGSNCGWNFFDTIILGASIMELALESTTDFMNNTKTFRLLRLARIVKVMRVLRLVQVVIPLRFMIASLVDTLKCMIWALLLLCIIIFAFSLVFTQAAKSQDVNNIGLSSEIASKLTELYGNMARSSLVLFQAMTGGIDWRVAVHPLEEISALYTFAFIVYISFVSFAVMNVITGTFCQSAIESAKRDHEFVMQQHLASKDSYKVKLEQLFKDMDVMKSGVLTLSDFKSALNNPRLTSFFESLEINTADAWTIFKLIDRDGTQQVDLDEFVGGCLRLRGSATSVDMAKILYDIKWLTRTLGRFMENTQVSLARIMSHTRISASVAELTGNKEEGEDSRAESWGLSPRMIERPASAPYL